eukprot:3617365-Prorocentrum_lima.AAC.1
MPLEDRSSLKKKSLTPAQLPQLDRCECGADAAQHFHVTKGMSPWSTYEHNAIHAQANLALMYLCVRQHPLLEWRVSAISSAI